MKAFLMAAALTAAPAFAQSMDSQPPAAPATPMTTTTETTTSTMTTDTPAPASMPMPAGQPMAQPGPTVDQADPAPPPKANYPVCSRTVQDACVERNSPK